MFHGRTTGVSVCVCVSVCVSVSTALMVRLGFGGYISQKAYRDCRGHYILYYPGFRIRGIRIRRIRLSVLEA